MKTLVLYYSFTENNEKLAFYLQGKMKCDLSRIETVKRRNGFSIFLDLLFNRTPALKPLLFDLQTYDHVIFLAPIWAGRIATPLRSLLLKEKAHFSTYTFITLCGGGDKNQKSKIRRELVTHVGREPKNVIELWVSKLIPDKKDISHVASFKIQERDIERYHDELAPIFEKPLSAATF